MSTAHQIPFAPRLCAADVRNHRWADPPRGVQVCARQHQLQETADRTHPVAGNPRLFVVVSPILVRGVVSGNPRQEGSAQNVELEGRTHERRTAVETELLHQPRFVGLDGLDTQERHLCNLAVAVSERNELEHLGFALAQ